jgi:pyridoxamine 5'-phosphate oxidase
MQISRIYQAFNKLTGILAYDSINSEYGYTLITMPQTHFIADLRKNYELAELLETTASLDPFVQFDTWLADAIAARIPEPNAMTLATVGSDLRPSTRIVLIKGCDARGLVWYTNYRSRKGQELAGNPFGSLQFHWVELERTVRIEGRVEKTSAKESDAYFHSRPLGSRIGAIVSPQSEVIADRMALETETRRIEARYADKPPRPPHWGGYRLIPDAWQFWQGRSNRLHDRLRYTLHGNNWVRERLAP